MGRLYGGAHKISGFKAPLFLCGWVLVLWASGCMAGGGVGGGGVVGVGGEGWGWWGGWVGIWVGWVVVLWGVGGKYYNSIIIFQGLLTKLNFLTKFPVLEKFVNLMKNLKYEHQSIFPLCGRVKLNFRDR